MRLDASVVQSVDSLQLLIGGRMGRGRLMEQLNRDRSFMRDQLHTIQHTASMAMKRMCAASESAQLRVFQWLDDVLGTIVRSVHARTLLFVSW
jgi:hypothetical protein